MDTDKKDRTNDSKINDVTHPESLGVLRFSQDPVTPLENALLTLDHDSSREQIIDTLRGFNAFIFPELIKALTNEIGGVRRGAIFALRLIIKERAKFEEVFRCIIRKYNNTDEFRSLEYLEYTDKKSYEYLANMQRDVMPLVLGYTPELTINGLIKALKYKDQDFHKYVMSTLIMIGKVTIPQIIKALNDEDQNLCKDILFILIKLGAVYNLIEALDVEDEGFHKNIISALMEMENEREVIALIKTLSNANKNFRRAFISMKYDIIDKFPHRYFIVALSKIWSVNSINFFSSCFASCLASLFLSGYFFRLIAYKFPQVGIFGLIACSGLSFFLYCRLLRWRGIEYRLYQEISFPSIAFKVRKLFLYSCGAIASCGVIFSAAYWNLIDFGF